MNRRSLSIAFLLAVLVLAVPCAAQAPAAVPVLPGAEVATPSLEIARHVTQVTGIAISPLLGVSAIGAYTYFTTSENERPALPWYAHPYFFGPAIALVLLLNMKEVFLGFVPPAKKIFDALEVVENKFSAVVFAAPMLIAATIHLIQSLTAEYGDSLEIAAGSPLFGGFFAAAIPDPTLLLTILALIVSLTAFFVVWLAGQAINLLILLSPIGFVDFLLKLFKFSIFGMLLIASLIHPYLGAVVSLGILFVAGSMASWTLRLVVFGTVLAWDIATRRHRRTEPSASGIRAFADGRLGRLATRTHGRLERDPDGRLVFTKISLFPHRRRKEVLPDGDYVICKGLMGPRIMRIDDGGMGRCAVLILPSRYRSHEAEVARQLGITHDDTSPVPKSVQNVREWLRSIFRPDCGPSQSPEERDAPA